MGRGITHRVIVKGVLTLDTSLHLGSGQTSAETDALLLRDTEGKILIPGTSIGGALRSRVEQLIGVAVGHGEKDCNCPICHLFGAAEGGASRVFVEDAYPTSNSGVATAEIRDGVAIRRDTQTAREGAKYDHETIPSGSTFDFELSIDLNDSLNEEMKKILYIGLEELCRGRISLGGNTTRGLGRCHLSIDKIYTLNFGNADCLVPFLKGDNLTGIPESYTIEYKAYFADVQDSLNFDNEMAPHTGIELDFDLFVEDVEDLLVVKDGRYAFGDDPEIRFVRTKRRSDIQDKGVDVQFIPGSSLKGPLRNRAEQILRTLAPRSAYLACDPTESGGCGTCAICKLFGFSKAKGEEGAKGRLSLEDAYPVTEEEIQEKKFDFVAIDRFTGGALEKAKFDARIATKGCFKTRMVMENPQTYELALIAHLFKDLYLKDIRLGYGKYKGFGRVKGILRGIRLLQTQKDGGLIAELKLIDVFPETSGYWQKSGIWHILTIPANEFRYENNYQPLSEESKLRTLIGTLDEAFAKFMGNKLVTITEGEE